eukprot:gnl/Chilomastix_cuspidata/2296.p1 GENE.gnl/Chilomastix_cuspidata/2296~~gnl/Chilomastix_cuspidata/2296.p1  ORF type:complete len:817 (+),score=262.61 gnl/Chilomastix_cuspidata/2296:37-2487(+)
MPNSRAMQTPLALPALLLLCALALGDSFFSPTLVPVGVQSEYDFYVEESSDIVMTQYPYFAGFKTQDTLIPLVFNDYEGHYYFNATITNSTDIMVVYLHGIKYAEFAVNSIPAFSALDLLVPSIPSIPTLTVDSATYPTAVALSGEWLAVGYPEDTLAVLYQYDAIAGWTYYTYLSQASDFPSTSGATVAFGASLALSENFLIVGDPEHNNHGIAFSYVFSNGDYVASQAFVAADQGNNDKFSGAIALCGEYMTISSPNRQLKGYLELHKFNGATWEFMKNYFVDTLGGTGFGCQLSISDLFLGVGSLTAGGYLFDISGDTLSLYETFAASAPKKGMRVFVSASELFVAELNDNTVAHYRLSGAATPWVLAQTIQRTGESLFGSALACSDNMLVVGAPGTAAETGEVFIYSRARADDAWSLVVSSPGIGTTQQFGAAVATDGMRAFATAGYLSVADGAVVAFEHEPPFFYDAVASFNPNQNSASFSLSIYLTDATGALLSFGALTAVSTSLEGNFGDATPDSFSPVTNGGAGEGYFWDNIEFPEDLDVEPFLARITFVDAAVGGYTSVLRNVTRYFIENSGPTTFTVLPNLVYVGQEVEFTLGVICDSSECEFEIPLKVAFAGNDPTPAKFNENYLYKVTPVPPVTPVSTNGLIAHGFYYDMSNPIQITFDVQVVTGEVEDIHVFSPAVLDGDEYKIHMGLLNAYGYPIINPSITLSVEGTPLVYEDGIYVYTYADTVPMRKQLVTATVDLMAGGTKDISFYLELTTTDVTHVGEVGEPVHVQVGFFDRNGAPITDNRPTYIGWTDHTLVKAQPAE